MCTKISPLVTRTRIFITDTIIDFARKPELLTVYNAQYTSFPFCTILTSDTRRIKGESAQEVVTTKIQCSFFFDNTDMQNKQNIFQS